MHSRFDPCYGGFELGDRVFHCWNRGGHGAIDHSEALAHSCDCFYYQLGLRLDVDQLAEAARDFGLGSSCGTVFSEEVGGIIPTRAWYNNRYGDNGWTRGVLLNLAIGQGEILVTPLQMALLAAQIATSGRVGSPTFFLREDRLPPTPQPLPFPWWISAPARRPSKLASRWPGRPERRRTRTERITPGSCVTRRRGLPRWRWR